MPNFLWRQAISLFLVFCPWGPIGSAPSYTPIFFFPRKWITGGGGWVGDLAPKFGWIWMKISSKMIAGLAAIPLGPSTLRGTFRQVIQMVQKARVAQVQWQLDKLGGFEIWHLLGRLVRWPRDLETTENLLGKVSDKHGHFQHFWWYLPGMGWLIFPLLPTLWVWGAFASLNTYAAWALEHQKKAKHFVFGTRS